MAEVTLNIDFSWKEWGARIVDTRDPEDPIYYADYKNPLSPTITFKKVAGDIIIGTGKVHTVNIDADYDLHGIKGKLKALRRIKTQYTHLSYNYSDDPNVPMAMTWSGETGLKNWTFTCMDENQLPVARFNANAFAVHKMANLELVGPKANNPDCMEEMIVTGITLYYCMALRANNVFNLFGAMIASPGALDKEESMRERARVTGEHNPSLANNPSSST